jgi:hypothetical protein
LWDGVSTFLPLILTTIIHSLDTNSASYLQEADSSPCLSQDIRQLILHHSVVDVDAVLINTVTDEVIAYVDVLAPLMEDGILAQYDGRLVIYQ